MWVKTKRGAKSGKRHPSSVATSTQDSSNVVSLEPTRDKQKYAIPEPGPIPAKKIRLLRNDSLAKYYDDAKPLRPAELHSREIRLDTDDRLFGKIVRQQNMTSKSGQEYQIGDITEDGKPSNWEFAEFGKERWEIGQRVSFIAGRKKNNKPEATRLARICA